MSTREQHLVQAKHNQDMLEFIDLNDKAERFRDWYVTVAFYTALHYFEAILPVVAHKINIGRKMGFVKEDYDVHDDRETAMMMEFKNVFTQYKQLYNLSRLAKYKLYCTTTRDKALSKKRLSEVKNECDKAFARWSS